MGRPRRSSMGRQTSDVCPLVRVSSTCCARVANEKCWYVDMVTWQEADSLSVMASWTVPRGIYSTSPTCKRITSIFIDNFVWVRSVLCAFCRNA